MTGLLARIRAKLATAPGPAVPDPAPKADPAPEAEPLRREHLFGSQYRVRMSFDELMAERDRTGTAGLYRRSIAPKGDARRDAQRRASAEIAGRGRDVLWPSEPD